MKTLLIATAAVVASLSATAPAVAGNVGVSVQISQPGIYGSIDIGRYPRPVVVAPQPVFVAAAVQPVLWVPPGHRRHPHFWHRYYERHDGYPQGRWEPAPVQRDHWHGGHGGRGG